MAKILKNEINFIERENKLEYTIDIPDDWEEFVSQSKIRSGNEIKPFKPYDYQRQLSEIMDNHSVVIVVKSRQLGITQAVFSKFLHKATLNPAYTGMIFCRNQSDSSSIARRAREMVQSFQGRINNESDSLGYMKLREGGQLYFKNGAREGGRGYDSVSDFLFDEAAFAENIESIYSSASAASAMVGEDSSKVIVSTPSAQSGWFWERLVENNDGRDIVDICTSIANQTFPPFYWFTDEKGVAKVFIHWRAHPIFSQHDDYLTYRQEQDGTSWEVIKREYDLCFDNTDVAVFNTPLIRENILNDFPPLDCASYYIGIDTATTGSDFTCAIVLALYNGIYYIVDTYRSSTGSAELHQFKIGELIDKWTPDEIGIEVTGGTGQVYIEQLSSEFSNFKFTAIRTTGDSKPAMIDRLKLVLEKRVIKYTSKHPIIEEMLSYRRNGKKLEASTGKHDDAIMALSFSLAVSPFKPRENNPFGKVEIKIQ